MTYECISVKLFDDDDSSADSRKFCRRNFRCRIFRHRIFRLRNFRRAEFSYMFFSPYKYLIYWFLQTNLADWVHSYCWLCFLCLITLLDSYENSNIFKLTLCQQIYFYLFHVKFLTNVNVIADIAGRYFSKSNSHPLDINENWCPLYKNQKVLNIQAQSLFNVTIHCIESFQHMYVCKCHHTQAWARAVYACQLSLFNILGTLNGKNTR